VHLKIALTYALGLGVTFLNILFVSVPMFLSEHDRTLLLILLSFAAFVALGFGQLMARSITEGLEHLARAADKIAQGNMGARATVKSGDEVGIWQRVQSNGRAAGSTANARKESTRAALWQQYRMICGRPHIATR
jgi:methyl-accepting chemotaxis protein